MRLLLVLAATAAALAVSAPAHAAGACGSSAYAYAGLLDSSPRYGVGATISVLGTPTVRGGHVAAWVGVGGSGLGPDGTDEWLQAGVSGEPDGGLALYYELALPGQAPRYVRLGDRVAPGTRIRVAVVESRGRRGAWRVLVNGVPRTGAVWLPGSHGSWRPVATTESWNGGFGACNSFAFGFSRVAVAAKPGGSWTRLRGVVLDSSPFRVARQGDGAFVASSAPLRSSRRTGCGRESATSCTAARGRGQATSS
jgi:hypothetical protein